VDWTFWGSYYGPPLVNHVRCLDCGYRFNGLTGRSNRHWALLFVTVPILIIAGIVGGFALLIHYADDDDVFPQPQAGAGVLGEAPSSPPAVLLPQRFDAGLKPMQASSGNVP
jgi:hypothetical protein